MEDLTKAYNPKEIEDKIYRLWLESGFFTPENLPSQKKEKFVTVIAPPNITGELHMGHALETTLQDIIVRMKRMQGYKTLWLPGTDHAGIAAQNAVEKQLAKEGTSRHKLGREKFLERMWQWKEKYGGLILEQFKKLGLSLDWTRLKFTMDQDYQETVKKVFVYYHDKGWIYQGERIINWCVRCQTSISDLEVKYEPEMTKLYFIKYGQFTLATARPETKLGDTGLAVYPSDERYKGYVGQNLEIESVDNSLPLNQPAKAKRIKIKVVADQSVDPEFGTGIIKVTPAHDLTDYEIAQRHGLPLVKIIDERGKMNENSGIRYQGMKTAQAREQIVKDLETLGLIEKVEDYQHNIGRCDRCDSIIEPLPSKQWFLKMNELAKLALEALKEEQIQFHPDRWAGPYRSWLENIRDWNISRQLWWGHKIPIEGEDDVLDTWFSSALWPFAALGWPDGRDFKEFYPTDFITSARDILFLWQVRMVFSAMELTGRTPFKNIYIHPTVLTRDGKRMSKSKGTGVDPLILTEKYGTDALRFGLTYQTTGVQDMRFNEDVILMGKKFANKIWNIARYVLAKVGSDYDFSLAKTRLQSKEGIVEKMNKVAEETTSGLENLEFGAAAHKIYDFVWHDFADKYLEQTKERDDRDARDTLAYLLVNCLKLLHPFMPFLTEEVWSHLPMKDKKLLLVEDWPLKN